MRDISARLTEDEERAGTAERAVVKLTKDMDRLEGKTHVDLWRLGSLRTKNDFFLFIICRGTRGRNRKGEERKRRARGDHERISRLLGVAILVIVGNWQNRNLPLFFLLCISLINQYLASTAV